ncbi:hypothetical protein [Nitrosococcus watsonii]|nr:hypothetical protein [Nitrosococcus watsonii]
MYKYLKICLQAILMGLPWTVATAAYPAINIIGAEADTRILFVAASYSTAVTPPNGAIQGARIVHSDGKPYASLKSVLPQNPIFTILRPVAMTAHNTWAGAFVEPTFLGELANFRDWAGAMDQWTDLVNQNRFPSPAGLPPGPILLKSGDVLILGPFNDCIHTLAGTKPACFDNHFPNQHLDNLFLNLDEVVAEAVALGLTVYVPGYPNFSNLDLGLTQQVLLPPGTEVINSIDYALLASEYEAHFRNRQNVVFIRTDDIIISHIGDGMHLKRKYHEKVANRIMQHFARNRGYTTKNLLKGFNKLLHRIIKKIIKG